MKRIDVFIIEHIRIFHVFRILFVCTSSYVIGEVLDLPYSSWAPITIVVVMASDYSGAVVDKANQRIIGTVIGAATGLALYFLPLNYEIVHYILLLLFLAVFIYFTIGPYSYSAVLASVTFFLVAGNGPSDLDIAIWRTFNVFWGAILAILASIWLFPAKATCQFKLLTEEYLCQLDLIYERHNSQITKDEEYNPVDISKLKEILGKISGLETSVGHESKTIKDSVKKIISCQVGIFNLIESIINTSWSYQYSDRKIKHAENLFESKQKTALIIKELSHYLRDDEKQTQALKVDENDFPILLLYPKIPSDHDTKTYVSYFGYIWLNRELARKIMTLSNEISHVVTLKPKVI